MTREGTAGGLTMGVEEEFLLADPTTARTVPAARAVLRRAHQEASPADGSGCKAEFLASQVESATRVCTSLEELRHVLAADRARLVDAAREEGLYLLSAGSAPLSDGRVPVADGERFRRISERFADIVDDYQVCGCHVHVGVPDRETAVAVVNRVRPWLPTLLALSVNSPFSHGLDRGYASWRMMEQFRFPAAGIPPRFPDAAAHDAAVERLVSCGALIDDRMSFWLMRPSPWLPTVEFRVADAAATVDEAVLQAALGRALVRRALAELAAGLPEPELDEGTARAAVWSAARYGTAGDGVDPVTRTRVPAADLVGALLRHVAPALEETGDTGTVRRLLDAVRRDGTGAERQRRAWARGGPRAVVELLASLTDARAHDQS
ncbi:glutamate--cysteine ligase [Streptomyces sp. TRM 70361]|uniref:carboxylate-amine ligase n=1 Tax=Streptomyces sp. TRM 70361 TaxID=3116553 RepID=UPI002E7C2C37|nr:glutamate--cysteine ligase [Streptomyces sp. TRM 70361]MEE1942077.1 glutamate--cysteine ligase [Streptomyces sp. TRM 70361]